MRRTRTPVRVLVLQAGARPGPWTCRSLAAAGHDVVAAHDGLSGGLTGMSRWSGIPLRSPSPERESLRYTEWLRDLIDALAVDVVMPVTEGVTRLLAAMPGLGRARRAGPDLRIYRALCDKDGLAKTASAVGLATPRGVLVDRDGADGPMPPAPCIVKPVSSSTALEGRVVYEPAVVAATDAERDAAVARIVAATGSAMVQEIVAGPRWRLHFARGGSAMTAVAWRTLRSQPRDTGMSSVSRMYPVPAGLGDAAARLLRAVDYRGIGSVQCLEVPSGFVVHDVNLRPVFSTGASVRSGFDLPRMAVEISMGDEPTPGRAPVRPVRYVWLSGELRAAAAAARGGDAAGATQALADIGAAALLRRRMLDPVDPRAALDTFRGGIERARTRRAAR